MIDATCMTDEETRIGENFAAQGIVELMCERDVLICERDALLADRDALHDQLVAAEKRVHVFVTTESIYLGLFGTAATNMMALAVVLNVMWWTRQSYE